MVDVKDEGSLNLTLNGIRLVEIRDQVAILSVNDPVEEEGTIDIDLALFQRGFEEDAREHAILNFLGSDTSE